VNKSVARKTHAVNSQGNTSASASNVQAGSQVPAQQEQKNQKSHAEDVPVSSPPQKDNQPRFDVLVRNAQTGKTTMKVSNVTQSQLEQYIYPLLDLAQSS